MEKQKNEKMGCNISIKDILKECSLDNRINILKLLENSQLTASMIRNELKRMGVSKPHATICRYIDNLERIKLISKNNGKNIHLTALGRIVLLYLRELENIINSLSNYWEFLEDSMEYLPNAIFKDIGVLGHSTMLLDQHLVALNIFSEFKNAKKELFLISGKIISSELLEIILNKKVKMIIDESVFEEKINSYRSIFNKKGFNENEIKNITNMHELRIFRNLPLKLMIIDNNTAAISFSYSDNGLIPVFWSKNPAFIKWTKKIFEYFWKKSFKVNWQEIKSCWINP